MSEKIKFITWPLTHTSGLQRFLGELVTGFEKIGLEVENVEFGEDGWDEMGREIEKDADYYFITWAAPHERAETRWWQDVYHQLADEPVIAGLHDPNWQSRYSWVTEVKDEMDMAVCTHEGIAKVLDNFPVPWEITRQPLDTSRVDEFPPLDEKEDLMISMNAFKGRKHMDYVVRSVPYVDYEYVLHNEGIEYYYMCGSLENRKEEYRVGSDPKDDKSFERRRGVHTEKDGERIPEIDEGQDEGYEWIWERALDHGMEYAGVVDIDELFDNLRRAKFHLNFQDSDNWTQTTLYTDVEPMLYGTLPVAYDHMIADFYRGHILTVDSWRDLPNLVEEVESRPERYDEVRQENFEFVKENHDAQVIAEQTLGLFEDIVNDDLDKHREQFTADSFY